MDNGNGQLALIISWWEN